MNSLDMHRPRIVVFPKPFQPEISGAEVIVKGLLSKILKFAMV